MSDLLNNGVRLRGQGAVQPYGAFSKKGLEFFSNVGPI